MMAFCRHVVSARHGTCCHHAVIMPACVYQGTWYADTVPSDAVVHDYILFGTSCRHATAGVLLPCLHHVSICIYQGGYNAYHTIFDICKKQLHRLFPPVKIFNKTDVCETWIHNFLFISHCHGFMESFKKIVYKLLYFLDLSHDLIRNYALFDSRYCAL